MVSSKDSILGLSMYLIRALHLLLQKRAELFVHPIIDTASSWAGEVCDQAPSSQLVWFRDHTKTTNLKLLPDKLRRLKEAVARKKREWLSLIG